MKKLLSVILMILMVIGNYVPAYAKESVSCAIEIEINGGGIAHIEGIEGDTLNETINIPSNPGKVTYEFAEKGVGNYFYKIKQIPGNNPDITYDDSEYIVGLYVYYDNDQLVCLVEVKKDDEAGKPMSICFENIKQEEETKEITRTIYYKEYDKNGNEVVKSKIQKVTLKRTKTINPDGTISYGDWEIVSGDRSSVKSPDHPKKDSEGWLPDRDIGEWVIDLTDPKDIEEWVFYTKSTSPSKKTYYVRFESGLSGKSDGKGNEEGKEYGSFPKGGNGITPNEGYKFTGKYSYVILDDDGNIIKKGMTDDPTSIEVIGNIIFTPIYEKINPLFPVPDTSDLNNSKLFISLLGLSAIIIIIAGYLRIKRK